MKSTLAIIALCVASAGAFQAAAPMIISPRTSSSSSSSSSSALSMSGFLEGRGAKITIRDDEDNAMWFDDGSGGRKPAEKPKKPDPKKPVKKETTKAAGGGFKFPWDK
ncbi:hypothetical protein ACHAW5_011220 [Stephanodiscus triporus]|uniref:Uncharacterized protein n=1 Tax=Stephanodiscus triporus TaxID=2934178 RepID=A0ABD3PEY9_9STRA